MIQARRVLDCFQKCYFYLNEAIIQARRVRDSVCIDYIFLLLVIFCDGGYKPWEVSSRLSFHKLFLYYYFLFLVKGAITQARRVRIKMYIVLKFF
jgi:hypothetical protein